MFFCTTLNKEIFNRFSVSEFGKDRVSLQVFLHYTETNVSNVAVVVYWTSLFQQKQEEIYSVEFRLNSPLAPQTISLSLPTQLHKASHSVNLLFVIKNALSAPNQNGTKNRLEFQY